MESLALLVTFMLVIGLVGAPAGWLLARSNNKQLRTLGVIFAGVSIFIGGQVLVAQVGLGGQIFSLVMIVSGVLAIRKALLHK